MKSLSSFYSSFYFSVFFYFNTFVFFYVFFPVILQNSNTFSIVKSYLVTFLITYLESMSAYLTGSGTLNLQSLYTIDKAVSREILCPIETINGSFTLSLGFKPAPQTFPDFPISF